ELVHHPAVDGAEERFARRCLLVRAINVLEVPAQLGAGEVWIEDEAGLLADERLLGVGLHLVADVGGAPALPNNEVGHRLALGVEQAGGLALVRDAYGGDVLDVELRALEATLGRLLDGLPDGARLVLDPARPRKHLAE